MSHIGKAIGGFFDGMLGGDDVEIGPDPSVAFSQKQSEMENQQKEQLKQQKEQLERQRISMMRGRFSGGSGTADTTGTTDADAANLFSRITGRNQ